MLENFNRIKEKEIKTKEDRKREWKRTTKKHSLHAIWDL